MTKKKSRAAVARRNLRRLLLLCLVLGLAAFIATWIPSWRIRAAERRFDKARQAIKQGDVETSLRIAADLEQYSEFAPHRHYLVGISKLRDGKLNDALTELQYACYHPQLELDAFVASGQALYQMGKVEEAVRRWGHVLTIDSEHVNALRWLSIYYYDLGATNQAEYYFELVAKLDLTDGRPHRMLGLMEFDKHNFEEAIPAYRESLRRDPNQPDRERILSELAEAEAKSHNYDEALEILARCQPSVVQQALSAECYLNKGDVDRAMGIVTAGLEVVPNEMSLLEIKGRCLLHQGELQAATQAFEDALEAQPNDFGVRLHLAQAYHRLGRTEEAKTHSELAKKHREMWQRFSELNADAGTKQTDIPLRLEIGKLALELDRPDLAAMWYRAVLYLDPKHEEAASMVRKLGGVGSNVSPTAQPPG